MEGVNKWTGLGNLAAAAEGKMLQNGFVLNWRLACSERYQDRAGEWKERTAFVPCTMYGKRAESLAAYMTKGKMVMVEGRFNTRSWEKDGEKRYASEIVVSNVVLCGGGERGGQGGQQGEQPAGDGQGGYGGDPEDYAR